MKKLCMLAAIACVSVSVRSSYLVRTYHTIAQQAFTLPQEAKSSAQQTYDLQQQLTNKKDSSFDDAFAKHEILYKGGMYTAQATQVHADFNIEQAAAQAVSDFTQRCAGQKLIVVHVQPGRQYAYKQIEHIAQNNVFVEYAQVAQTAAMSKKQFLRSVYKAIKKRKAACVLYIVDAGVSAFSQVPIEKILLQVAGSRGLPCAMYAQYVSQPQSRSYEAEKYQQLLCQVDREGLMSFAKLSGGSIFAWLTGFFLSTFVITSPFVLVNMLLAALIIVIVASIPKKTQNSRFLQGAIWGFGTSFVAALLLMSIDEFAYGLLWAIPSYVARVAFTPVCVVAWAITHTRPRQKYLHYRQVAV